MTLTEFQEKRNTYASRLQSIDDMELRKDIAKRFASKCEAYSARQGWITQTFYWVWLHAGLL